MTQSNWYCKLPWTGFSNDPDGRARPCCLYKNHITDNEGKFMYVQTHSVKDIFTSKFMQDLRSDFRSGNKPIGCQTCIIDEENGYTSKRQIYNDNYLTPNYNEEPEFPIEYQMILSNACNLKCRSCTPSHSSLWQDEYKDLYGTSGYNMPNGQSGNSNSVLWNNRKEWLPSVKRLEIVGGEPFYINKWRTLWQEMIDQNLAKDINIDMSSNGTIYGGDIVENLVKNFRNVGVGLSIDGLGKTYEYLRHPAVWNDVEQNILKYHDLRQRLNANNFSVSISHTIGWINAWELPEFHLYILKNTPKFSVWNNIIHYPPHMAIWMIPQSLKIKIENKWRKYDWKRYTKDIEGIIKYMNSKQPSDNEIKEAYKVFLRHDKIRNENLLCSIPEEIVNDIKPFIE